MRSICSGGIASSAVAPLDAEATRMPSISTSVCAAFAPRRNTPAVAPGPPFWTISTPGWRCSNATMPCAPPRAISSASITVTSATRSSSRCGERDAVTTIGSSTAGGGGD